MRWLRGNESPNGALIVSEDADVVLSALTLPNTSILHTAFLNKNCTLSACFVRSCVVS